MPALLGGLFIGVLSALPIVNACNCCCLWIFCGGVLAAHLQQQNQPGTITVLQGARVGVTAGVIGAIVWLAIDTALSPLQMRFLTEAMRDSRDLPPEVQEWMDTVRSNPAGSRVLFFVLMATLGSAVSTIGGMVGAAYFRKDVPPALGGPISPPPPLP